MPKGRMWPAVGDRLLEHVLLSNEEHPHPERIWEALRTRGAYETVLLANSFYGTGKEPLSRDQFAKVVSSLDLEEIRSLFRFLSTHRGGRGLKYLHLLLGVAPQADLRQWMMRRVSEDHSLWPGIAPDLAHILDTDEDTNVRLLGVQIAAGLNSPDLHCKLKEIAENDQENPIVQVAAILAIQDMHGKSSSQEMPSESTGGG